MTPNAQAAGSEIGGDLPQEVYMQSHLFSRDKLLNVAFLDQHKGMSSPACPPYQGTWALLQHSLLLGRSLLGGKDAKTAMRRHRGVCYHRQL